MAGPSKGLNATVAKCLLTPTPLPLFPLPWEEGRWGDRMRGLVETLKARKMLTPGTVKLRLPPRQTWACARRRGLEQTADQGFGPQAGDLSKD